MAPSSAGFGVVAPERSWQHLKMDRDDALAQVRDAFERGEYLIAYDAAREAAEVSPDNPEIRYAAILALARAGALERAAAQLDASNLSKDRSLPDRLTQDVAALGARLAKDRAVRAAGDERRTLAQEAAERYEAVYERFRVAYPCVNAATMWLLAGNRPRAEKFARDASELAAGPSAGPEEDYWQAATVSEAALILGRVAAAAAALERAAAVLPVDLAARAATRRQLALICDCNKIGLAVLDTLPVPMVIHYCGHRVALNGAGALPADAIPKVRADTRAYLEERRVQIAYGSLAAGADLVVAEALLERGAELHAFLPLPPDEFVTTSVADAGDEWVHRFDQCIEHATSVTSVSDGPYLDDHALFDYCARIAMGHALIRAQFLTAPVEQLAVWDGRPSERPTGTAVDVATWQNHGRTTRVIASPPRTATAAPTSTTSREVRAMLFADVEGFSVLDDAEMTAYSSVLEIIAETLDKFGDQVLHRRTWGDGLHLVFRDVVPAAECALDIQEALATLDWIALGFRDRLRLRIGGHAGPVIEIIDAVCRTRDFTGSHVVRTARVEPRTPAGDVYVTDAFAALLTLENKPSLSCQYVGHIPAAKDYGNFPMFVLMRRSS